ncbi:hypothetical protein BC829DRAFT_396571, partial [Chytridium lagenaria]
MLVTNKTKTENLSVVAIGVGTIISLHAQLARMQSHSSSPLRTASTLSLTLYPKALSQTPRATDRRALKFVDLGSGMGGWCWRHQIKVWGLRWNSVLLFVSLLKKWRNWMNLWRTDLSSFDIVMVFGDRQYMGAFREKLERELKTDALVISNLFAIPGWHPLITGDGYFIYSLMRNKMPSEVAPPCLL